jgi:hypothetical protein
MEDNITLFAKLAAFDFISSDEFGFSFGMILSGGIH